MGTVKEAQPVCIYCLSEEPGRTREHVIPQSIGGGNVQKGIYVLPEASCLKCKKRIETYEKKLLQGLFPGVVFHYGFSTTSKATYVPVVTIKNKTPEIVYVESGKEPGVQCVPHFKEPGIFRCADPSSIVFEFSDEVAHSYYAWHQSIEENVNALNTEYFWAECDYDLHNLARFLCKVAHGIAVQHLGFYWVPFALPIALRVCDHSPYIVGCRWLPVPTDELHHVRLFVRKYKGHEYYVVQLWFFTATSLGEKRPVFEVVVGRPVRNNTNGQIARLEPEHPQQLTRRKIDPVYLSWPKEEPPQIPE